MQLTIIMFALHIIHNQRTSLRLSRGDSFIQLICALIRWKTMQSDWLLCTSYYEKAMEIEYTAPPVGH